MEEKDQQVLVEHIGRLVDLDADTREALLACMRLRLVKKGQYLVHAGGLDRSTYFIVTGCLRSYFIDREGQEHVVQFPMEGWWAGDLRSFILQQPAQLHLQAIEDCRLLELPHSDLHELYERSPRWERYMRIIMQRSLVSFQERMVQVFSQTAEERYDAFCARYPQLEQRIPQRLIASYIGITPEFLSRLKARRLKSTGD